MTDFTTLESEARARIAAATDLPALEALRVEYLGKQGSVSALLKSLGAMAAEERLAQAPAIQALRQAVSDALTVRKQAMEAADYQGPDQKTAFIEALEAIESFPESREHPQGEKVFNAAMHQSFGHQYISRVEEGRLNVVHTTAIEDGMYEPEGDYTQMPL